MTLDPRTCRQEDDTSVAARILWEQDCGCVPVVSETGKAIGMITDRDICMAAYTRGLRLHEMSVGSVMSRDLTVCQPKDSILIAERRMAEAQVRRLPVVDASGALIGLLSLNDIARWRESTPLQRAKGHVLDDVALTLAKIGEHRSASDSSSDASLFAPSE